MGTVIRGKSREATSDIRKILQLAANDLERKMNEVPIVCKGTMIIDALLRLE